MNYLRLAALLPLTLSLAAFACSSSTSDPAATPDSGPPAEIDSGERPAPDSGADAAQGEGTIGTRTDKGMQTVPVDISGHGSYRCDQVCTAAGGACTDALTVGAADYEYNSGKGRYVDKIPRCDAAKSYVQGGGTSVATMTRMYCFCSDMPITTVRVGKAEGLFACAKVCASWSLACSTEREHYSYANESETSAKPLECSTVPDATTDHYTCACDPK